MLEGVEAVGLWLQKRWAEYLTLISTSALLPLEVYELDHERVTVLKVIALVVNIASSSTCCSRSGSSGCAAAPPPSGAARARHGLERPRRERPGGRLPVLSAQRPLGQAAAISATWRASVPQQPPTTLNRSSRPASAA